MSARSTKKGRAYQRDLGSNPYIEGVTDFDGKIAIRPLNDEEFEWLEKFNNEFVEGNFIKNENKEITEDNLHYSLIVESEALVSDLKAQIKAISYQLMETNGYRQMNDRKAYFKYKKNLYKQHEKLKEELESVNITGNIYNDKYARRFDVMAYVGNSQRTVRVVDHFSKIGADTNEGILFEYMESTKL